MAAGARRDRAIASVAVALTVLLAACTSDAVSRPSATPATGQIGHVPRARARAPKVRIEVAGGCPRNLGQAHDVANRPDQLASRLVPDGLAPINGIVCEYVGSPSMAAPVRTILARQFALSGGDAARLATALRHVSLAPPHGEFACPNQRCGADAVIALGYRTGRTVDLWYSWTGCQTIDNGYVLAFQGANESFYSGFQPVFDQLAPLPR